MHKYLPIFDWLPGYNKSTLRADVIAGITVSVMLIPQSMAYALLAGLPPIYGLYASIVPLLLYAFFGTSRQLSVGPVALASILVLAGLSQLAEPGSPAFIQFAIVTALLAGIIQVFLGVFRLGFLIKFLSHSVIAGFTSAAALIIAFSQLKSIFGIQHSGGNKIHEILHTLFTSIEQTHFPTLFLGLGGIIVILLIKKINKALPSALIITIAGILVVYSFSLDQKGVAILGQVPKGLPAFSVPQVTLSEAIQLMPLALTICLISFIESLAIAKTLQAKHKDYRVRPNQELLALGITKIGGAFFQAFPTTGSFSRSAINDEAGAKTGISSIIAAAMVVSTLLFFTPLIYYLPKAILAAIIVMAVIGLINFKEAIHLWHLDKRDFWAFIITFIITLLVGIQEGVFAGVILSVSIILYQSTKPYVAVLGRLPKSRYYRNISRFPEAIQHDQILIMRFDAQLYFGNSEYFTQEVEHLLEDKGKELQLFILDASSIYDIDSQGVQALHNAIQYIRQKGILFYISGTMGPLRDMLYRSKLMNEIGKENQFMTIHDAVNHYSDNADSWSVKVLQTNE